MGAEKKAEQLNLSLDSHLDPFLLGQFQHVFEGICADDARQPRMVIEEVVELQDSQRLAQYLLRRNCLAQPCRSSNLNSLTPHVRSQTIDWTSVWALCEQPLDAECNEFYLFRGVAMEDVAACRSDTGCSELDSGNDRVHLAEHIVHAQDLAARLSGKSLKDVRQRRAILVCRAFCGRICDVGPSRCTASPPIPVAAHRAWSSISGEAGSSSYNSTMWTLETSDMKKPTSTREFLLPSDQVLPEFVVIYREEGSPTSASPTVPLTEGSGAEVDLNSIDRFWPSESPPTSAAQALLLKSLQAK